MLDRQLPELLELLRQVASAVSDSPFEAHRLRLLVAQVRTCAGHHFASEHALMGEVGVDPDYLAHHRRLHEHLLAQWQQLEGRLSRGATPDSPELLGCLVPQLMLHMLGEDPVMMRRINATRAGGAGSGAPRTAGSDVPRSPDEAAPFESLLGLCSLIAEHNQHLAERNAELSATCAQLSASEARYRSVLAALPVGVVVQEPDGRIVLSNVAAQRLLGLTEEELAVPTGADPHGQAMDDAEGPVPAERHPWMIARATGQPQRDVTIGVQRPDGSRGWLSVGADRLAAATGDAQGSVVSWFVDITAQKSPEMALSKSQQPQDRVLERTGTGIWDWDLESGAVHVNTAWYTLLGFDPDEVPATFEVWERLMHPDDLAMTLEAIARMRACRNEENPYDVAFRMRTQGGTWRWIHSRAVVIRRDAENQPARMVGMQRDPTEPHDFESALHHEQAKRASLFRLAPIGIAMAVGRVLVEVNDTFCRLTGYPRDELIGRDTRFLYADQAEYDRAALFKYRSGGEVGITEVDTRWVRKDGRYIDVVLDATPVDQRNPGGGISFTVLDVTERRQIEVALRETEEAYRLAMEATEDGVWDWDITSDTVRYSPAWLRIVEAEHVPGRYDTWASRVHPDDWPEVQRSLREHLAGSGTLWQHEHRLKMCSGGWKWVLGRGRVVKRDPLGRPLRMVGTTADISERKAAERERAVLSDALEASLNEIYLFDAQTLQFRYANQGALSNLGYSLAVLRELSPLDIKPKLTPASFRELLRPLRLGQRKVQVFQSVHQRADGSLYPVDVHLQLFRHDDGEGIYLAVIQDATERKRAEASLQASEERFHFWVNATDSVFWVADPGGALTQPSLSLERLTGLSRHKCLGYGRLAALHPDDRDAYTAALGRAVARGEAFEFQLRYWDVGAGAYRWYLERGVPHRAADGAICGWLGASVSIDRQKRAEAAQQDMLRRKDEFIALLGHELRNPLAPIRNANEVLGTVATGDPTLLWVHDIIERHTSHLVRLVDDLLDVGRLLRGKITLQREPIPVAKLLRQLAESHGLQIAARAQQLTLSVPDEGLVIDGDAVRLTQIFDNLLSNAVHYTAEGGQIWLSAERDGRHAVVRVIDSGIGIPDDLLPHIFDPFAQGERALDRSDGGLGIGLTVARQLILLHKGDIEARSAGVGRGSEFVVRLPLVDAVVSGPEPEARLAASLVPSPQPTLRILVVDDNLDAANSLTLLLDHYGHVVETARDGNQALDAARRFQPDLVLLDIGLPGIDGFEVARLLRQMDEARAARIIAVTGYAQAEYRVKARRVGIDGYLVKPIRLDEIRRLLEVFGNSATRTAPPKLHSVPSGTGAE